METICYKYYVTLTENFILSNPKVICFFVKSRYNSNVLPNELLKSTGELICGAFSSYFHSTLPHPPVVKFTDQIQTNPVPHWPNCESVINIVTNEVAKLLQQLDISDGVDCWFSVSLPVSILINKSLSLCVLSLICKPAFLTPVHKRNSKIKVTNNRPILKLYIS